MSLPATLVLLLAAMPTSPPTGAAVALEGLPRGQEVEVLGAILTDDHRASVDAGLAQGRRAMDIELVAQATRDGLLHVLGVDAWAELDRIVGIAAPHGGAVPAGVAVFVSEGALGFQVFIKGEAGAVERLAQANAVPVRSLGPAPASAPYVLEQAPGGHELLMGERRFPLVQDAAGWLRVGSTSAHLVQSPGTVPMPFSPRLAGWLVDCSTVAYVQGQGLVGQALAMLGGTSELGPLLQNVRTLALGFTRTVQRTQEMRLLVDAPLLQDYAHLLRSPDLNRDMLALWGPEATSLLSLSLTAPLLQSGLLLLREALSDSPWSLTDGLTQSLDGLTGTAQLVGYHARGDWSLGLEAGDPQRAASFARELAGWLEETLARLHTSAGDNVVLLDDQPDVLLLRPDRLLEGVRVTSIDRFVIVSAQRARHEATLTAANQARARPFAGPVTQPIRQILDRAAVASVYSLVGGVDWLSWYIWPAKLGALFANNYLEQAEALGVGQEVMTSLLQRLPALMAVGAASGTLVYDAAVSLDVDGSVAVLRAATSEL